MSRRTGGKYWSASVLKKRGWTNEQTKQLLPKPHFMMRGGHPTRMWRQEEVLRAEQDPSFSPHQNDPNQTQAVRRAVSAGVRHTCALLSQAWEDAPRDHSPPWLLAGHYHSAILARLLSTPRSRMFSSSQSTNSMKEFLCLFL